MSRLTAALLALSLAGPALAQATQPAGEEGVKPAPKITTGEGVGVLGICVGTGLTVLGGAWAIAHVSGRATESIARQPEASGNMFLAWLLPAAMIEGVTLFGVLVCYLACTLFR